MKLVSKILKSLLDLVYPPLCIHCGASTCENTYFCFVCLQQLEMIEPSERCPHCFSAFYSPHQSHCKECSRNPSSLARLAATFDYKGPAETLIKAIKYGNQPYLARAAGAYMTAQWLRLGWPLPDLIIPVPISFMHRWERGYNQSFLLAQAISSIIERPVVDLLQRSSEDYSQAGLKRSQRRQLEGQTISLKKGVNVENKCLLLIDDVLTTGATLSRCAEVLFSRFPAKIEGLVFCKTVF